MTNKSKHSDVLTLIENLNAKVGNSPSPTARKFDFGKKMKEDNDLPTSVWKGNSAPWAPASWRNLRKCSLGLAQTATEWIR